MKIIYLLSADINDMKMSNFVATVLNLFGLEAKEQFRGKSFIGEPL
jgi:hypothetical protein